MAQWKRSSECDGSSGRVAMEVANVTAIGDILLIDVGGRASKTVRSQAGAWERVGKKTAEFLTKLCHATDCEKYS
jgi:hypothetical protein